MNSQNENEEMKELEIDLEIKKPSSLTIFPPNEEPKQKYKDQHIEKEEYSQNESIKNRQPQITNEMTNQNKIKGYFGGIKLIALLTEDEIPLISKIMIIWSFLTVTISYILYIDEIDTFANSICPEKQYLSTFIIINVLILFPIMLLVISLFNLELINKTPYNFKLTFLRPWLLWGVCPVFEMPLMVFDHLYCKHENPLFSYADSYNIMNAIGIISLVFLTVFIGFITCLISGLNCHWLMDIAKKMFFKVILPVFLIALNVIAFLITFTQIKFFLPALYFHNYVYYLMVLMIGLFYFMLSGCKMQKKFHFNEKIMEFSKINR